jgi:hypothetical protein
MTLAQHFTNLSPVTIASFLAAGALAATRLLTTAKPLWNKLPASLQGLLPALVLVLPQLAAQAAGVKTGLDLVNLLVLAGAMILPGFHSHTVQLGKPSGPGSGALVGLVFALGIMLPLGLVGCARLAQVDWSKPAHCADTSEYALVIAVEKVLDGTDDLKTELGAIAETYGPEAVVCAVKQIVGQLGTVQLDAKPGHRAFRGRDFLVQVGQ